MSATKLLLLQQNLNSFSLALPHQPRSRSALYNQTRSIRSSEELYFRQFCASSSINYTDIVQKKSCRNLVVYSSMEPGTPIPTGNPSGSNWKAWLVGMLISIILPFYRTKLTPLLALRKEVETVVDTAELVLDVVEKVAEEVAEVADNFGDKLPEGGKLKEAVERIENVAREIAKDADLVENLLQKVEKAEKEIGSLVEPVIDQANKIAEEANTINTMTVKEIKNLVEPVIDQVNKIAEEANRDKINAVNMKEMGSLVEPVIDQVNTIAEQVNDDAVTVKEIKNLIEPVINQANKIAEETNNDTINEGTMKLGEAHEVETIVEEAKIVAEVVEKVAEEVVEIADALDKKLPEGGKLKDGVEFIENAAKEIVKDANIAEEVLHKVEEVEKEVRLYNHTVINHWGG